MCGICGIVAFDAGIACDEAVVTRMRDELTHRGPDDAGVYVSPDRAVALGHRRLSIVDLSAAGHQPMANEDGTVWIAYNGEVYNHGELRAELEAKGHRFRSRTDTEAILHLYEELGPACVERLHGMFALAIWDGVAGSCFWPVTASASSRWSTRASPRGWCSPRRSRRSFSTRRSPATSTSGRSPTT